MEICLLIGGLTQAVFTSLWGDPNRFLNMKSSRNFGEQFGRTEGGLHTNKDKIDFCI